MYAAIPSIIKNVFYKTLLISSLALITTACSNINVTMRSKEQNRPFYAEWKLSDETSVSYRQIPPDQRRDREVVGIVQFATKNDDGTPSTNFVEVTRLQHGYAAQTRLYETEQSQTNFLIGHDDDSGFSASIRWRWKF